MKLFMREPDGKRTIFARKVRAYFDLIRPFTLVAPVVGGSMAAVAGLVATDGWHRFDLFTLMYGIATLMFLNAASNSFNQVTDLKIDRINKPYRPIPSGALTRHEALSVAFLFYALALWRSIWVNPIFATCVVALVALTWVYSAGPRFKRIPILNNFNIAVARGGLGLIAGWSIFTTELTPLLLGTAILVTVYLTGMTLCKDLSDIKGDRSEGMMTMPVMWGERRAVAVMLPFGHVCLLLAAILWAMGFFGVMGIMLGIIYALSGIFLYGMYGYLSKEGSKLENNRAWVLMYIMVGISYLWLLLMTIFGAKVDNLVYSFP